MGWIEILLNIFGDGDDHGSRNRQYSGRSRRKRRSGRKSARKDTVAYSLKDRNKKRTYIGSTKNPARREAQHRKSGKLKSGGSLVVESAKMTRRAAERLEGKKLAGYKRRTGRLPKHNTTADGRFHRW